MKDGWRSAQPSRHLRQDNVPGGIDDAHFSRRISASRTGIGTCRQLIVAVGLNIANQLIRFDQNGRGEPVELALCRCRGQSESASSGDHVGPAHLIKRSRVAQEDGERCGWP
jgi:hypothetical protein